MNVTVDYKNFILHDLKKMPCRIKALRTDHPSYAMFVAAVKIIIDWGEDRLNGFCVEFNSTYTRMKKFDITPGHAPIRFFKKSELKKEERFWKLMWNKKTIIKKAAWAVCQSRINQLKPRPEYKKLAHLFKIVPA